MALNANAIKLNGGFGSEQTIYGVRVWCQILRILMQFLVVEGLLQYPIMEQQMPLLIFL